MSVPLACGPPPAAHRRYHGAGFHETHISLAACRRRRALCGNEAFNGRWTIEPAGDNNGRVLWLEVNGAGTAKITGWMVGGGPGGQLDAIHNARIERGHLRFHLERRSNRTEKR